MSFSCPHFDINRDHCVRTRAACVPGRPGCVLQHNSTFAVPPALRIEAANQSSPAKADATPQRGSKRAKSAGSTRPTPASPKPKKKR